MSICTIPPAGWGCSREPGHEGPCAATPYRPYDEYINRLLRSITHDLNLTPDTARERLIDAWMDGLKYSLIMIESEKRRRDDSQD